MRQALMVICAFALGKAVSAAPAARPYENPATVEYPVNSYESPTPMNYYEPSPYGSSPYSPIVYPVAPTLSYYPEPYPYSTPMAYYPPASSYYDSGYYSPVSEPYQKPTYQYPSYQASDIYPTTPMYEYPTYISSPGLYPTQGPQAQYPSYQASDVYPTTPMYEYPTYISTPGLYPTQGPQSQYPSYPSPTYNAGNAYPIVSSSPAYPSMPTYPVCEIEIITYLIEVVIITDDIYLNEYRYLIYTPAEGRFPYAFGSIGKSIHKPDAHPAIFWVTSGSLDDNTASLAEYYKGYPHDVAPSYSEAYYLWIYEYQIAVVYISLSPPAYAAYTEFGVDYEGHLTYGGKSYWALCPSPDCEDTWYVYWIGSGSAPYGCRTDVFLRLARYGFSSPKSYYENKGSNSGSYPPIYGSPSYISASPYSDSYPTPVDQYPQPQSYATPTMAPHGVSPTMVTYPMYTSMVNGEPVTEYETVTSYYTY